MGRLALDRSLRLLVLLLALCGLVQAPPAAAQFSIPGFGFGSSDNEKSSETTENRDLGTAAVALVEDIRGAPGAGVEIMDYVFPGQTIKLGGSGVIVLNHLDGCLVETVTGGTVTVKRKGSEVSGGRRSAKALSCRAAKAIITAENREAGAVVNRVALFKAANWKEQVVKTARPVFKWKVAKGDSRVRIVELDREEPAVIWETRTGKSHIAYPAAAPPLKVGMPYRVEVALQDSDDETHKALFSIDPNLEAADNFLARIVTLSR